MTSFVSPLRVSRRRTVLTSLVLGLMSGLTGLAQSSLATAGLASSSMKAMPAAALEGFEGFSGYTGTTSCTPYRLAFLVQPSNVVINSAMTPGVQVQVEDCLGDAVPTGTNTITLSMRTGSGIAGNVTAAAVNGVATFNPTFTAAGTDALWANGAGFSPAGSSQFTVAPSTPATSVAATTPPCTPYRLAFLVQPSTVQINSAMNPGIQVQIEDCSGKVVPTGTNTITLSMRTGTGIAGTVSVAAVKGIATIKPMFTVLGKDVLWATGPGFSPASSAQFTVAPNSTESYVAAQSADALVDSVGINVHLNYTDTPYVNFSNVESGLQTLGVRHIRDGLTVTSWAGYYSEHNQLGQLGIKSVFITDVGQTAAQLEAYPSQMSLCFEGYEAPNEYDNRGVASWTTPLKAQLALNQTAISSMSTIYPIYGASLVNSGSFATLGNVAKYFNYGNLHNYPGGNNPGTTGWGGADAEGNGYGGLAWQMDLLNLTSPNLPVVTTETGYFNTVAKGGDGVPEAVSAVYLPRMLLTQWAAGIQRTYLYELVSEGGQDYGLFRADWSAKPGFYAISNLLNLMSDPGTAYTPSPLYMGMTGGDGNFHHLLFGKRDGSYYLAVWLEESSFNLSTLATTTVSPETVTVQLPIGATVTDNLWDNTGTVTTSKTTVTGAMALTVTDKLQILKIVQ